MPLFWTSVKRNTQYCITQYALIHSDHNLMSNVYNTSFLLYVNIFNQWPVLNIFLE